MGTERGGCSRLMKTPRHNGGAVHSRSMRAKKKDNHCSGCHRERERNYQEMGIKVLSLFDGISCGMVALERAGIKVERYVASEIDESAIEVSKSNYEQIEHIGDVREVNFKEYEGFELLIGGSPCQDLCGMGSRKGLEGEKSGLFFEFVRALKEIKPQWFLLENNASMTQKNRDKISEILGCEPVLINSADFSAQNRKRLYWTNIQIEDFTPQILN